MSEEKEVSKINQDNTLKKKKAIKIAILIILIVAVIIVGAIFIYNYENRASINERELQEFYSELHNNSNYKYSDNYDNNNDSYIFNNLDIYSFSCNEDSSVVTMTCQVKNNNSYTVTGYFYVNFYDSNGDLIYTHLMSLPDVASGEIVTCSTPIRKDEFPANYDSVQFSQSNLTSK